MFKKIALIIAALLLSVHLSVAQENTLTVVNQSTQVICFVLIAPTSIKSNDEVTDDMFHAVDLRTSQVAEFTVAAGLYHIGVIDCKGNYLFMWSPFPLTEPDTLTFTDTTAVDFAQVEELEQKGLAALENGAYDEALGYLTEALDIVKVVNQRAAEGTVLVYIGNAYSSQGQYEQALESFTRAADIMHDIGNFADEAGIRAGIGQLYVNLAQYDPALDSYTQALAIFQTLDERAAEGEMLARIGSLYVAVGQYDQALDYLPRALEVMREIDNLAAEGEILSTISLVYNGQGQYEQALDHLTRALEIARTIPDSAIESAVLNNFGALYVNQKQYTQALDSFTQSLTIRRELGDRPGEGEVLNNIGTVYNDQGRYGEAIDHLTRALDIAREVNDLYSEGKTLASIGNVYLDQRQFGQALDYYTRALAIQREVRDRVSEGTTLNNIGNVYQEQAQYGQALDYYTQALQIRRAVGDRAGVGGTLINIAIVYTKQGQYGQALDFYTQALDITRELGDQVWEGSTLQGIGVVYEEQGQHEQALDYYTQALEIRREADDRVGEGASLGNLGGVYLVQEQYEQALDYLTQALVILREMGDQVNEGVALTNIGYIYQQQGQYEQALDYYNQAYIVLHEANDRLGETTLLVNRAGLYEKSEQPAQAISDYRAAASISEQIVGSAALESGITSLANQWQNDVPYSRLAVLLAQPDTLSEALDFAERGRAILTRTELSGSVLDFRANVDSSLVEREIELRLAVQSAQKYVDSLRQDASAAPQALADAEQALEDARQAYDQHLETMQLQGGFLAREVSFRTATLEQIQSVIPDDTTLVVYSITNAEIAEFGQDVPKSVVFLITQDHLQAVILDVTASQIDESVRAFAADRLYSDQTLADMYQMVFAPIANQITTSRLIISPDGPLNYVPFAALYTEQDGERHYLIDDYSLSMIPSATALWLLSERQLAVPDGAGLVMSQDEAPNLPPLPRAFIEAGQVAQLLRVEAIRDGTETQLRDDVVGKGLLYVAAHAQLDHDAPLYSTIYLAEDDSNDGRLEVREIYELDLSQGTELVVLSGCETGSGGSGEDFGLMNRAFFAAGAQQVVSSLWTVDDAATAELLVSFMQAREQNENSSDALRAAMLAVRAEHPEPYLWAAFVLNGLPTMR